MVQHVGFAIDSYTNEEVIARCCFGLECIMYITNLLDADFHCKRFIEFLTGAVWQLLDTAGPSVNVTQLSRTKFTSVYKNLPAFYPVSDF